MRTTGVEQWTSNCFLQHNSTGSFRDRDQLPPSAGRHPFLSAIPSGYLVISLTLYRWPWQDRSHLPLRWPVEIELISSDSLPDTPRNCKAIYSPSPAGIPSLSAKPTSRDIAKVKRSLCDPGVQPREKTVLAKAVMAKCQSGVTHLEREWMTS